MTLANMTRENYARAAVEGLLCLMAVGLDAQRAQGVLVERVSLIGGGAKSEAVRKLAPAILGLRSTSRIPASTSRWVPPDRPRGCWRVPSQAPRNRRPGRSPSRTLRGRAHALDRRTLRTGGAQVAGLKVD